MVPVAMRTLDRGRLHIAAVCVGIAQRLIDDALRYAAERRQFGRPVAGFQLVQAMLADSQIDLDASRLLIWRACWELDQGRPARGESSGAKVFVAEAVQRVVDRAIQICGALGISEDLPLSLFYREIRPFRVYDGPTEVHKVAVARRVLRQAQARLKPRA